MRWSDTDSGDNCRFGSFHCGLPFPPEIAFHPPALSAVFPFPVRRAAIAKPAGLCAILDLRFFILAGNNKAGGDMGNADCGIGRVDGLPAGSGRAERIDPKILFLDCDLHFFRFRQNGHGDRRSMNASAGFGRRHSLHPMNAALVFHAAVDTLAFNEGNDSTQLSQARRQWPAQPLHEHPPTRAHAKPTNNPHDPSSAAASSTETDSTDVLYGMTGDPGRSANISATATAPVATAPMGRHHSRHHDAAAGTGSASVGACRTRALKLFENSGDGSGASTPRTSPMSERSS